MNSTCKFYIDGEGIQEMVHWTSTMIQFSDFAIYNWTATLKTQSVPESVPYIPIQKSISPKV